MACARSDGTAGSDVSAGSGTSWTCWSAQNMTSVVVSLGSKHSGYSPEHEVARKSGRAAPADGHHGGPRGATPSSPPG